MFSSRLQWNLPANPLSRLLEQRRAAGAHILDLTESNPTKAGIAYPQDRILSALADPRSLLYDPDPAGLPEARAAVASYYQTRVDRARILLTASTSEAYGFVFKLLADPGCEILVPRPSYPLFDFLAALESLQVIDYPLVYHDGWTIDFDALASRISPLTRAIVVVNPNNPTGSYLKRDELRQLEALCRGRDIALISDEVFTDYAFEPDPRRVDSLVDSSEVLSFSLSGLSKVAGLPQMKLGWIVVNGPAAQRREAFDRLELLADTYLSVGAPVQWASSVLLDLKIGIQDQIRLRTRANLAFLRTKIGPASPWRVLKVEGGWYAILQAPRIQGEEEWVLSLISGQDVLVQPGFFFDFECEAYLIVSLLTPEDRFRQGIERILAQA